MSPQIESCAKHVDIIGTSELFTKLCQLECQSDLQQTLSEVPELRTAEQLTEFCNMYDKLVAHYQALGATESEAEPSRQWHQAVNWLNRMFSTEPAIGFNKKVMVDFYFTDEQFTTVDMNTRTHYQQLMAINAFYLVLAALNQQGILSSP